MAKKKRRKATRQEWNPNFLLKLLTLAWKGAFAAAKIALGAVATVACIIVVCCFVLVGALGDYLQDETQLQ